MSFLVETLSSPIAVVSLGMTALVLMGTTLYVTKISGLSRSMDDAGSHSHSDFDLHGGNQNGVVSGRKETKEGGNRKTLDRAKYPGGHLTIYYGSQTGTAQMFAKQIASESESNGFLPRVVDLQDVVDNEDFKSIEAAKSEARGKDRLLDDEGALIRATLTHPHYRDDDSCRSKAVFLVATYGEGEATDNALQFVEIMKIKSGISNIYKLDGLLPSETCTSSREVNPVATSSPTLSDNDNSFLHDLDYAVFGLGNKQYEHYNNMGRFVDAALEKCGGIRLATIGLGDDDDDLEADFEMWKDTFLWPTLRKKYIQQNNSPCSIKDVVKEEQRMTSLPPCNYTIEYLNDDQCKENVPLSSDLIQTSSRYYTTAVDCPVLEKKELRDSSDPGSTLHIQIDISNNLDTMKYQTADNLGVLPKNDSSIVEAVASALNFELDQYFILQPNASNDNNVSTKHTLPFPMPCTVRDCLERYCDLTGSPRRSDLKQLALYARDSMDSKALLRMSSKEGKNEYKEKIVGNHIGIADIVTRLCPSIVCPLEHFIMICPRLQPRYYTISSSAIVHPNTIHITLSVLEESKKDGGYFKGCCTGFLDQINKGEMVRVFLRQSTFRVPKQPEQPIIMIGPGTGIAPMRAILQERSYQQKACLHEKQSSINILYFGCKKRTMDYIYRDELECFQEEGTLTELHLAFSREQEHKVYVQHLLEQQSAQTWKLIHYDKASIFICGAVKMGADVDHTLQNIISQHGDMNREEAKAYLDKMAISGRFVQELWS